MHYNISMKYNKYSNSKLISNDRSLSPGTVEDTYRYIEYTWIKEAK